MSGDIAPGTYQEEIINASGTVSPGNTVSLEATQEVKMTDGFHAQAGSEFRASIGFFQVESAAASGPSPATTLRDYINGIEYANNQIEAIYFSEGRIFFTNGQVRYEYYLKDHLDECTISG